MSRPDLSAPNLSDGELAARLAGATGAMLREMREAGLIAGRALGDAGDRAANEFLCAAILELRPDDGLLSEESRDGAERCERERVWIIDPVDGTREYGEGRGDWAVHVGLAIAGEAVLGAVALPGLKGPGVDGAPVHRSDRPAPLGEPASRPRFLVSRSRPASEAVAVCEAMGGETIAMGSAGAKAMAVVRGEAEIYLHSGGQYEWDSCAPVAVARAHGLHCSRIDGSPLTYNRADPYLPDLLICRPDLADRVLSEIARLD